MTHLLRYDMAGAAADRRKELKTKIAVLSEEIEELQFEEKSVMRVFDKTDAAGMKRVEDEISKSVARIVKLDAQEVEFTSAISREKEKFDKLKAQVVDLDRNELADARLAIRPQMENEGRERIRKGTPDGRVSFVKYQAGVKDADKLLRKDDIVTTVEKR